MIMLVKWGEWGVNRDKCTVFFFDDYGFYKRCNRMRNAELGELLQEVREEGGQVHMYQMTNQDAHVYWTGEKEILTPSRIDSLWRIARKHEPEKQLELLWECL